MTERVDRWSSHSPSGGRTEPGLQTKLQPPYRVERSVLSGRFLFGSFHLVDQAGNEGELVRGEPFQLFGDLGEAGGSLGIEVEEFLWGNF